MNWHDWINSLTTEDMEKLEAEIMASPSRLALSLHAKQYYLHLCISSPDKKIQQLNQKFVMAQIKGESEQNLAKIEDEYYQYAKEIIAKG